MDFGLTKVTYIPTLGLRPSEMRALEELPNSSKDRMRPVVLFAPWVGARQLSKAIERLDKSLGQRPFFLDLDPDYSSDRRDRPAVRDFFDILENDPDNSKYFELVQSIEGAVPCLRVEGAKAASIRGQLNTIGDIGRGFALRIRRRAFPGGDFSVLQPLIDSGLSNFVLIVDAEWTNDLVSSEVWMRGVVDWFDAAGISVPVVTSLSSFPKSFTDIEGVRPLEIGSRIVFNNVSRAYNRLSFIYGDWATTKPRDNGMGRTPADRIDFPTRDRWFIFRKRDEWDFLEASKRVIASESWNPDLDLWGHLMIEKTAAGDVTGITSAAKNVAARVNIHLHQQAWFEDPFGGLQTDDPWEDEL